MCCLHPWDSQCLHSPSLHALLNLLYILQTSTVSIMTCKFKIHQVFEVLMQTTLFSSFGTGYTEISLHLRVSKYFDWDLKWGWENSHYFSLKQGTQNLPIWDKNSIIKTRMHRTTILTMVNKHEILPTNDTTVKTALLKVKVYLSQCVVPESIHAYTKEDHEKILRELSKGLMLKGKYGSIKVEYPEG